MRTVLVALMATLLAVVPASAATVFDDPRALIAYVYAPYLEADQQFPDDPTEVFSPTLRQLWEEMSERSAEAEMPVIDFDPLINAQDYEVRDFLVADPAISGDSAIVVVSFVNLGEPQELHFNLIRRAEGWKIDDIESVGTYAWRLSELLAADPLLN